MLPAPPCDSPKRDGQLKTILYRLTRSKSFRVDQRLNHALPLLRQARVGRENYSDQSQLAAGTRKRDRMRALRRRCLLERSAKRKTHYLGKRKNRHNGSVGAKRGRSARQSCTRSTCQRCKNHRTLSTGVNLILNFRENLFHTQ